MAKLILCFCIALGIFALFKLNLRSDGVLPVRDRNDQSAGEAASRSHLSNGRTRDQVLDEMRINGLLGKDFSEWFVSPDGSPAGTGKIDSPVDLETAFQNKDKRITVKAGDVIWLRGGTYKGTFTVKISGNSQLPVHYRQHPGERVILDKASASRKAGTIEVRGSHVWFWDFEVTNSYQDRSRLDPDGNLNPWRGSGINVWASNTKYINLVVHDNGHGFGVWNEDGETEIYSCLIFNNGNNKKEHGIYAHNKTGTNKFVGNIIFNNAGYGLHIYANSIKSSISGFDILNNTIFENGTLMNEDQAADQILVGGVEGVPARRITLRGNIVYTNPGAASSKSRGIRLGYRHRENEDVKLYDNLVVGRVPLKLLWWNSVEACGNTIVSSGRGIEIATPSKIDFSKYRFSRNSFLSNGTADRTFGLNGQQITLEEWYSKINNGSCGMAVAAKATSGDSPQPNVFVNRNRYDRTLAYVTVYNGDGISKVSVELGKFLKEGEKFAVWDAQNYFGEPVSKGTFQGKPIALSLEGKEVTRPVGKTERIPAHTGPKFSVFVIRKWL